MSEYHGDIDLGDTVQWLFTTVNGSGVPTILTGSPTATAYTDGGVTQSATGVTLTADFDGVTGQNLISIVATGGNGFTAGENIEIALDAGTVDGNSVVGYAIGGFSIANRSPLRPTTIGRTLDVLATGEVPMDFDTSIGSLAAGQIEASALDGKGDWNVGKTGYTLTQAFPTNFADMSITVTTGLVDITQAAADKVFGTSGAALTELSQGIPSATPRPDQAVMLGFMALRNKLDVTSSFKEVHNDAGTVITKKALTDDGSTYSEAEMESGP